MAKNLNSKTVLFDAFPKQIEFIEAAFSGKYEFIGYFGSIRGGKTFAMLGLFLMLSRIFPGSRWVIIRKDLARIKATVLPTFYELCPESFTESWPSAHNQWTWTAKNGSHIIFYAENIDKDPELKRFRGFEYDGIGAEEMDICEKTFTKLFERCGTWKMQDRQSAIENGTPYQPAFVAGTSNPQPGYVKEKIYELSINGTLPENWMVINAKLTDNVHIPESYIEQLRRNLPLFDFLRFVEGNWDITENDKPFFYSFNADLHISTTEIVNHEPLYLSFDFNIDPTTVVIGQKIHGQPLMIHQVIQVKGGTEKLCNEIEHLRNHPAGLIVTGDFSGNTGSTAAGMLEGGIYNTDFNIIKNKLYLSDYDFVSTKAANPRHDYSRRVCNYIFERSKIHIDPDCKVLITDIQVAQVTDKGKLRKDRDTFKMDACDAFRYMVNAWFPNGFADIQTFNDLLL